MISTLDALEEVEEWMDGVLGGDWLGEDVETEDSCAISSNALKLEEDSVSWMNCLILWSLVFSKDIYL